MTNAITVLLQMVVLFAMMATGFTAYKKGVLSNEASAQVSKLVVNVFNPLLVLNSVMSPQGNISGGKMLVNLGMVGIYFLLLFVFGCITRIVLRPPKERKSLFLLMTLFSNVGFMGIPVIQSVFGQEAVAYVAFYMLSYNVVLYTLGNFLAERAAVEFQGTAAAARGSWKNALKKMLNPGVFGSAAAILILAFDIRIPAFIGTFCNYMGNMTIPLSMMLIGATVAQMGIKEMLGDGRMYVFLLLKMVAFPVLTLFLFQKLPIDRMIFGVFILELGMPVGNIVALMTKEKGADEAYCTQGIVLSTLVSIVTIPIICLFL